ncbi:MAG: hypothetical protein H7A35_02125 [Planctomycetales bacterium]|nr:hypothetical protein [bacterium]UNM08856.1 MAG: hypothetical protein H7A35_02125 [Planctomycetales bacterium]
MPESVDAGMLPSMGSLGEAVPQALGIQHATSLAAPGWYELALDQPDFSQQASQAVMDGGGWQFDAGVQAAWKIWAVGPWPGDSAPTGLNCLVSSVSGEYYLACSDFFSGRWKMFGPFNGDTEQQYDPEDPFASPKRYTSPLGLHYIALVVPPGGSLHLDAMEVGAYGGSDGPLPVGQIFDGSSATNIMFSWQHSGSFNDADFLGYSIERQPQSGGAWLPLNPVLLRDNHFTDLDIPPGQIMRYRIGSWDTAGNVSYGQSKNLFADAAFDAPPVMIAKMPTGPLHGPAQITIDLSDSYDPDGTDITAYSISFGANTPYLVSPDPVNTVTLQPGCYYITIAGLSNGKTGTTDAYLKVYPQWQADPTTVVSGPNAIPRAASMKAVDNPDGSSTLVFYDIMQPGITALTQHLDGSSSWDYLPLLGTGNGLLSEPARTSQGWLFSVYQPTRETAFYWDGSKLGYLDYAYTLSNTDRFAIAANAADEIYYAYMFNNGLDYSLMLTDLQPGGSQVIMAGLPTLGYVDMQYDPVSDSLDIIYGGNNASWIRRHADGSMDTAVISAAATNTVNIEQDPATGRPCVLMFQGTQHFYSALNEDLLSWSAPQTVDAVNQQFGGGDLLCVDGTQYAQLVDSTNGVARLYRNDAGLWTVVNTADFPQCYGPQELLRIPGDSRFRRFMNLASWDLRIDDITSTDSESEVDVVPGVVGNGLHMMASSSTNELHMVQVRAGKIYHFHSSDAVNWTEDPVVPNGSFPRLCSDILGNMFMGYYTPGFAQLVRWDGNAFVAEHTLDSSNDVRPLLSGELSYYFSVDDRTNVPPYMRTKMSGDPQSDIQLDGLPVWDGQPVIHSSDAVSLVAFGGTGIKDSKLGVIKQGNPEIEYVCDPVMAFAEDYFVASRVIDGSIMVSQPFAIPVPCWHVAYGPEITPIRVSYSLFGNLSWETLPFSNPLFQAGELRRTVSSMSSNGLCSVAFVSDNSGPEHLLEWSNFGDWETLSLPAGRHYSQGQLATGPDGRWHLFYRDLATDEVKVLSTL